MGGNVSPIAHQSSGLAVFRMSIKRVSSRFTWSNSLVTLVVAKIDPERILGIVGKHVGMERSPALLEPVGKLDLDDVPDVGTQHEWMWRQCARLCRRHFLVKDVTFALRIFGDDLAFGLLGLDDRWCQRIEIHWEINRGDIEGLDRRIVGIELLGRLGNFLPPRQRLQVTACFIHHSHNPPHPLTKVGRTSAAVHIIPGLLLGSTGSRDHQVVTLSDAQVHGTLWPRLGRIPFKREIMPVEMNGMHLVAGMIERTDHNRIA